MWAPSLTVGLRHRLQTPRGLQTRSYRHTSKMKRDYIEFQERSEPLGYFISFRCHGTWLHGDKRGSVNRRSFNAFGTPKMPPNANLEKSDRSQLKNTHVLLDAKRRSVVEVAIREVCAFRGIGLVTVNVRTNHVHLVVLTNRRPEPVMNSFKAYATRSLREKGLIGPQEKVWSRHGSTRYLWTEEHIASAVEYVVNGQGGELPRFD